MGLINSLSILSRAFWTPRTIFWSVLVHMGGLELGEGAVHMIQRTWMCLKRNSFDHLYIRKRSRIMWHKSYDQGPCKESRIAFGNYR